MAIQHKDRKEYRAAYIREHYKNNKQYYLDKAKKRQIDLATVIREAKSKPCTDCGVEYAYYVMQFDHLGDKEYDIALMARRGFSIKKIMAEIAKCEVVCANCHCERTHQRRITEVQPRSKG